MNLLEYLNDIVNNKRVKKFHDIKNQNGNYIFNDSIKIQMLKRILINEDDIKEMVKALDFLIDNKNLEMFNEFIHASHRIYFQSTFEEYLQTLTKGIEYLKLIIEKIDFIKFSEINEELIKILKRK